MTHASRFTVVLYVGTLLHVTGVLNVENYVFVSAFSVTSASRGTTRTGEISTERNFGENVDVDIFLPTRMPVGGVVQSPEDKVVGQHRITMPVRSPVIRPSRVVRSPPSQPARKYKRHEKMARPKSLHSSSNKIGAVNTVTSKTSKFADLLTKEEEVELTISIRNMRAAERIRDDLVAAHENHNSELPWQPSETEWAVACGYTVQGLRSVMQNGPEARSKLVAANGGLVRSIAKKHYYSLKQATQSGVGTILTLQDMIQEGNLGLMEAAERFDPERGFRFSTYATWWVRQRILRSISEYSRVIRLPAHVHSVLSKINKAKKEMKTVIGRSPSVPELAHFLEMSVEKVQKYTDSSRSVLSLEVPLSHGTFKGEDRRTLGDKIMSDSPTPEESAEVESLRRDILSVVNELAERERDVLVTRFGLDDGSPKTLEETSKRLGMSRDIVRNVETRALNKLRQPQRNYKLKEYVGADAEEEPQSKAEPKVNLTPERIWSF